MSSTSPESSLLLGFASLFPPTLVHPNVFWILMGCGVLNPLYQMGISLVEICFIYTLKLGIGGRLSMSAHSPRLQFVTGLPGSPKTEAKGVVLVKGLRKHDAWLSKAAFLYESVPLVPRFVLV